MDKRIVYLSNWISSRYFKKRDIEDYFKSLKYLDSKGVLIKPSVIISPQTKMRKLPDVFLMTGVSDTAAKKINDNKIFLSCSWRDESYTTYELVPCIKGISNSCYGRVY